jgi:hypothetical protein
MSDLEKISSELVVIAYQDKFDRVKSLEKLEKEIPKMTLTFTEEQKKLIIHIIAELKEEASVDEINSTDQIKERTPPIVQEKEIEVIEPDVVTQAQITDIDNKESKVEEDLSFLEEIDNAF